MAGWVYVRDKVQGYILGKLVDIGIDALTVEIIGDENKKIELPFDDVFAAEEDLNKDVDDNCALMYLNEGTLLHNLKLRYNRKQIYTYVANLLISVNPYEKISGLYDEETMMNYRGKSLGSLPPHLYAIADKAYRDMRTLKQSQSILVLGESGAGKTESQKSILKYLCHCYSQSTGRIEESILNSNPILEAFGNAKTSRNNNSSRFGKFVEVHFDRQYNVIGGYVSHYLLEKSRVCHQLLSERNYHVFFQLFTGEMAEKLKLTKPVDYNYLRHGCTQFFSNGCSHDEQSDLTLRDSLIDDANNFELLCQALNGIGFDDTQRNSLFNILGGILHLGNVEFSENVSDSKGGSRISDSSETSINNASQMLGLDLIHLSRCLTSRLMQPTRGGRKGTLINVPLKVNEAIAARDAFAKTIYSRLFDYIVSYINKCISSTYSHGYIGILDIAGFESFDTNSFEQLCINYCNEKLQLFFNQRIMQQEQLLYEKECLGVPKIDFVDNEACIDLFEANRVGIFPVLDEEAKLPQSSSKHFTSNVNQLNQKSILIEVPRKSQIRRYRTLRDDEGFIIHHYAGPVCYETGAFLDKNNDALHESLEALLGESNDPLLSKIFGSEAPGSMKTSDSARRPSIGRLNIASVSSKFRTQLELLLNKLNQSGTNFIHCVKPNDEMKPSCFNGIHITNQLKCSGMINVLKLMQNGYPSRVVFSELYDMYHRSMPSRLAELDPRQFCQYLFKALGLRGNDYKFGLTKIFFRAGKMVEFDQLVKQDTAHVDVLVKKAHSQMLRLRWRKVQYGALCVIKLSHQIKYRAMRQKESEARRKCWKKLIMFVRATVKLRKMIENKKIAPVNEMPTYDEEGGGGSRVAASVLWYLN
ncbi:myosin head (motor domain) domain-containing protein [Ditylenchus destructor]|nr:myosin head (motor domain) domain-containing protein [Ditylenchus destructor]